MMSLDKPSSIHRLCLAFLIVVMAGGCDPARKPPATLMLSAATTAPTTNPYLLHLPGIAGEKTIDRRFVAGIQDGGFHGPIDVYDWTEHDPGIAALLGYQRNHKEAKLIADRLAQRRATHPNEKIYLTSHSGGGALAVWALQDLPPGVTINTLVMMSPALSPDYDLTAALKHVSGHAYVFSSLADLLVLGTGTRLLGTMDGVKTDAAGRVGFTRPPTGDPAQYKKLIAMPYDPAWMKYGDMADHIGGMTRPFAENIIAPLILQGKMPAVELPTTTQTPTGLGRELPR
jgi:pimeloyl-ACP methyl ester carboxylesterase